MFKRRNITLDVEEPMLPINNQAGAARAFPSTHNTLSSHEEDCTVLVVNSSQDMAKEITMELQLRMPGCSIMYAPTLQLARWILSRRKIDLIVSCPVLPDGHIARLKDAIERMETPPNLVVVGDFNVASAEAFERAGYQVTALRRMNQPPKREQNEIESEIRTLGADLRNDLNNPLQEIVAMVFVAQYGDTSPPARQALDAIDKAAHNLASVVRGLEDKILKTVERLPIRS